VKWRSVRPLRLLCFDIENKPGTYGPGDYTHPKVTAVACQFVDEEQGFAWCFRRDDPERMSAQAEEFRGFWDSTDAVMGHNIRRHDQKILDGMYAGLGIPLLSRKRMVDTYLDQPKMQGYSRSLENLADRWGCPEKKIRMSEYDWEQAYDEVPEGVAKMRERVLSDVRINIWLYHELVRRNLLAYR
jgi:hypothetical protein